MYKYDIPQAKEGQFELRVNGIPCNCSKKLDYLKRKMKAFQDKFCDETAPEQKHENVFEIVDNNGAVIFQKTYKIDERGNASESYSKHTPDPTNYVTKDGFKLIADKDGNILTDENLLHVIRDFTFYHRVPTMITKAAMVGMATYKPQTKDEFIHIKGLGEKIYNKCGEEFISLIKAYIQQPK